MATFCDYGVPLGARHFLYGGNPGVAEKRLVQEPRRLWRRYLVHGSQFIWLICAENLRSSRLGTTSEKFK